MSDSFWPHEPQHTRPPCPSPAPRVYSNSCPSSQWCHPAISSSAVPFSCPQSLPASGSFPVRQVFAWRGQSIRVSASASVLPMNTQDWSPLGWTGWISLQSKGLSRVFSNTTVHKTKIMASGPITSWEIDGETVETLSDLNLGGSKITADGDCSHEIKKRLLLGRKVMTNLDSILKSRDIANKGPSSQDYGFSSGHVWMWELDSEESWALKNWCFWTVAVLKTTKLYTFKRMNFMITLIISFS